jgi:hypothetical protein
MRNTCLHAMTALDKAGCAPDDRKSGTETNKTVPDPVCGSSVSGPSHAAKGGAPPPPTIMAMNRHCTLPRLLMAATAPAMTRLPLNVVIVDNDRGDSPSSYRARALRAGAQEVPRDTLPHEHMQGGSRCPGPAVEPERARWHDPVLPVAWAHT